MVPLGTYTNRNRTNQADFLSSLNFSSPVHSMAPPNIRKQTFSDDPISDHQPPSITIHRSILTVDNHLILSEVPPNITLTPTCIKTINMSGSFLGFTSKDPPSSRHVVSLGKLKGIKFMSIFSFKVWWSSLWVGNKGSDLEYETQFLLLDKSDSGRPYVLLLPIIEGSFRACIQPGNGDDSVDVCVESGSDRVVGSSFKSVLYMHVGDDPYKLVKDAMKVVRVHLDTFKLLEEKTPPKIVDKFGWCTWDAFYEKVHPDGVWEGVKGLVEGGCPPGLLLIDEGWQSIGQDDGTITDDSGRPPLLRLTSFEENKKFKNYQSKVSSEKGMGALIKDLKREFKSLESVYVWHAVCGYFGGLRPNVPGLPESRIVKGKLPQSSMMCMEDGAVHDVLRDGVGLVPPEMAYQLFDGLHSYLESVGVDGVKVDCIHVLAMLSEDYGGRVELAKAYYKALSHSLAKHFKRSHVIASMQQSSDFMFLGTETTSLGRVVDDFWSLKRCEPGDTFWLQGLHVVHCAYNSLWMGNFIHPDWDMFVSLHPCAGFHAASRAISGGPIFASDPVGEHDFQLLKSLVLPDGTILRCEHYALPTRDCLFEDPLHDGKTILKIWNLNKFAGVLGVFNCQGGGWCPKARRNKGALEFSHALSGVMSVQNIEWKNGKTLVSINGVEVFVVYMWKEKKMVLQKPTENREIILEPFAFELFTISPVKTLPNKNIQFAPIGLVNMLNSGGAIQLMSFYDDANLVRIGMKGRGEMRAFASGKPRVCRIDGEEVSFLYDELMVVIQVPWSGGSKLSIVDYQF